MDLCEQASEVDRLGVEICATRLDAPGAIAALDGAFGKVLADAVPWLSKLPVVEEPAKDEGKAKDADIPEPEMPEAPPAP